MVCAAVAGALTTRSKDKPLIEAIQHLWTRLHSYPAHEMVLELAVIWAVVFLVFRFLRGTRGARVLKGVGLILIIASLLIVLTGDSPGLPRLEFLFQNFLTFAALALVIVFQPELRRALVRLGEARLFRGFAGPVNPIINEVVEAVTYLSANKIGALIAIEREVGLGGIIEGGSRLNADVRSELLRTIFWPGSALHDMGVVIRGDKIMAASVPFPMHEGNDVAQDLGSRHRAALGLSEEADCLVIVVSEETGTISMAERGQLLRGLAPEQLRSSLRRSLVQARPPAIRDVDDQTGDGNGDVDEDPADDRSDTAA